MRRRLALQVSIVFLLAAGLQARAADPVLGPERPIHVSPVMPTLEAEWGVVASLGSDYLVAWVNPSFDVSSGVGMLRAARVSAAGKLLDAPGFPLAPTSCQASAPLGVGGSRSALVTFECQNATEARVMIVGRDGSVRDVELGTSYKPWPVAWTGDHYVALLPDQTLVSIDEDGEIIGRTARVASASYLVRRIEAEAGRVIAILDGPPIEGDVTTHGLYLVAIDGDVVTQPVGLRGVPGEVVHQVSFDGERLLVGFLDAGVFDRAMLFELDGTLVRGPFDLPFSREFDVIDILWQGERHIVRYGTYGTGRPLILRLDRNGDVVDEAPVETVEGDWAVGGSGILAVHRGVWREPGTAEGYAYGVFGTLLDREGAPLWSDRERDIAIATSSRPQEAAVIGWTGRGATAVWLEQVAPDERCIYASSATTQAREAIRVACGPWLDVPSIAAAPGLSLVIWRSGFGVERKEIFVARVSSEDGLLDAEPIRLSSGAWLRAEPKAIWDGEQFVAVWGDGDPFYFGENVALVVSRITREGVVLDRDPVRLGDRDRSRMAPALERRGDELVLAWEEGDIRRYHAQLYFANRGVFVRRLVTRSGLFAGPVVRVAGGDEGETEAGGPGVACHELGCIVTFGDVLGDAVVRSSFVPWESLVTGAGSNESVALAAEAWSPAVVWDGRDFAVAWVERNGADLNVVMRRLDANGVPDGEVVDVAATNELESSPSLASPGDGTVVVSYARTAPELRFGGTILNFVRRESTPRQRPARR